MSSPNSKFRIHALMFVASCLASFFLVRWINAGYWDTEPWMGGRSAWEMRQEFDWLEPGINGLVNHYSVPLGVAFALALYGAMATFLELGVGRRPILLAGAFLFTFPLVILAWFFIPLFFAPLLALSVFIASVARNETKAVNFSVFAVGQSVLASICMYN